MEENKCEHNWIFIEEDEIELMRYFQFYCSKCLEIRAVKADFIGKGIERK